MRQIGWLVIGAAGWAGCGHCDGGIRGMDGGEVAPDATFSILADGPGSMTSDELLADAGIDAETWFLLDDTGAVVPSAVFGDWGGHSCLNGNTFTLAPDAPLAPGAYTLVLRVDALAWDYIGEEDALDTYEGEPALVVAVTVLGT